MDPDGKAAWMVAGAAFGGITSYITARSKGVKGWKLVRATFWGAALGAIGGPRLKVAGRIAKKFPYRVKGYSKSDGRLFSVIKRSGKNKGRKFSLDYHQIRETVNGKKRRSHRKVLHVHFGKNIHKHRVIYPRRKKIKWIN
ncbi:hypothetical protein [Siminovitchia sp. 179-K 8D1 HS]|uniref:hypothetical protein n=1 Tax=Siminovitchia sp. 179-K 8D1 HS TaxID=3142385 RepID=UPI0039A28C14